MKHNKKTSVILLTIFVIIQIVGILVINSYRPIETLSTNETIVDLPFNLNENNSGNPISILTSLVLAIFIISILLKYKLKYIIKFWFLIVVVISIGITINAFIKGIFTQNITWIIAITTALTLGILKVQIPNKYIHNATEILIYPGVATILLATIYTSNSSITNIITIITILIGISIYDIWGVRKSKIITKMAKYQMEEVKVFGGLIIPSLTKEDKLKIKLLKQKYTNKKIPQEEIKKSKIKTSAAILGGGDIAFTTLTMGIFAWTFPQQILFNIQGLIPAIFVLIGALAGLSYIMFLGDTKKPYPAMPYITIGILATLLVWWNVYF